MLYYENKFRRQGYSAIIGVDEAGRGPLAGPVVAAAVCLKSAHFRNRIDDSKKLTSRQRENAFPEIIRNSIFGVGIINEKIIDQVNILEATYSAMEEAIRILCKKLDRADRRKACVIVDGLVRLDITLPYTNIIKGDSKSKSIAAASILAKVVRDRIMASYNRLYPQYDFLIHKGYPTPLHKDALRRYGPSLIHRMSFSPVRGF